jgi:hypothetical protein
MTDLGSLYKVSIDPEMVSRGTGRPINRQESIVYDFMPRIIGVRFRTAPLLRAVHFYGGFFDRGVNGPFLAQELAYGELFIEEFGKDNLTEALEAYKRGLYNATEWIKGMARIQNNALFSQAELQELDVGDKFREMEEALVLRLAPEGKPFDLDAYSAFLDEVRQLEKDARQLNQLYFMGAKGLPHEDTAQKGNPETGRKLRDTYARMQRYSQAAWISEKIEDPEAQSRFEELAKTDPKDNPRFVEILEDVMRRHYSDRY